MLMSGIMGDEADQALFNERVKQINRACLKTFLPYILIVISILGTVGWKLVDVTVHHYQEAKTERKQLFGVVIKNHSDIKTMLTVQTAQDRDIQQIKDKVFK